MGSGAVISVFAWDEATKTATWGGPEKLPAPDPIARATASALSRERS